MYTPAPALGGRVMATAILTAVVTTGRAIMPHAQLSWLLSIGVAGTAVSTVATAYVVATAATAVVTAATTVDGAGGSNALFIK